MTSKDIISTIECILMLLFLFVSINFGSALKVLESIILIVLLFYVLICNLNFDLGLTKKKSKFLKKNNYIDIFSSKIY